MQIDTAKLSKEVAELKAEVLDVLRYDLPELVLDWPEHQKLRRRLATLFNEASLGKAGNQYVCGESRLGKTTLVNVAAIDFIKGFKDATRLPLVKITMPTSGNEKTIHYELLRVLRHPSPWSHTREDMFSKLRSTVKRLGLSVILIDEVQHAVRGKKIDTIKYNGDVLKRLGEELRVSLVLVGCEEITQLMRHNRQLPNRGRRPITLEPYRWENLSDRSIVCAYLQQLDQFFVEKYGFARPAGLAEPKLAWRILEAAGGIMGRIYNLVRDAADFAQDDGAGQLGLDHLALAFAERSKLESPGKNRFLTTP